MRAAVIAGGRRFKGGPADAAWLASVVNDEGITHVLHADRSWTDRFVVEVLRPSVDVVLVAVPQARERLGDRAKRKNIYDMMAIGVRLSDRHASPVCIAFLGGKHTKLTVDVCRAHCWDIRTREARFLGAGDAG